LSKFHVTSKLETTITPEDKILEKSRSFFHSDKNTPVIGALVRKVVEINGGLPDVSTHRSLVRWQSDVTPDSQYPNSDSGWMQAYARDALDGFDFAQFEKWIESCRTAKDTLSPVLCSPVQPPKVVQATVVDNDVALPEVTTTKQRRSHKDRADAPAKVERSHVRKDSKPRQHKGKSTPNTKAKQPRVGKP
jgi:hypothetical protein